MSIWTGIGMNYGHQVSPSSYDTMQVESDLAYLKQHGVSKIRIAFPEFDDNSGGVLIAHCQDMVARALSRGFYAVWGVAVGWGPGTITATRWAASKAYITGTLAPWAQSVGLSELCLGNEDELALDGTTITASTMRSDIRSMASSVKSNGFKGKVSYASNVQDAYLNPWISEGIGALDLIGWNSYDVIPNFNARNVSIVAAFGSKGYISEFGSIANGYADFNNENLFYVDTLSRIILMKQVGIPSGYFFCYRDGSFGVPANSFALVETNGLVHLAREAVIGKCL
jgi:hypothetical protein